MAVDLLAQFLFLVILAIPVACVSWTVAHEELLREPREFCRRQSQTAARLLARKFFYVFSCEYCFSHYVTLAFVALTRFKLLLPDWRGYVLGFFSVVWVANIYMSIHSRLRVDIRAVRADADIKEQAKGGAAAPAVAASRTENDLKKPED